MKLKYIIYSTISAIFLIFVYLISSRLVMGLSPYLIFSNTLVIFIAIYKGRKLPLYKVLGHTALVSLLLIFYVIAIGMFIDPLFNSVPFQKWFWYSQVLLSLGGLLLAWYLQISLFFLKNKNSL